MLLVIKTQQMIKIIRDWLGSSFVIGAKLTYKFSLNVVFNEEIIINYLATRGAAPPHWWTDEL